MIPLPSWGLCFLSTSSLARANRDWRLGAVLRSIPGGSWRAPGQGLSFLAIMPPAMLAHDTFQPLHHCNSFENSLKADPLRAGDGFRHGMQGPPWTLWNSQGVTTNPCACECGPLARRYTAVCRIAVCNSLVFGSASTRDNMHVTLSQHAH
jgi:hypothetical protein